MAVSERTRRLLYESAEASWGKEVADTLMELLPPIGWADVATKQDLAHLAAELRADMHALEARLLRWIIPTVLTGIGVSTAITTAIAG